MNIHPNEPEEYNHDCFRRNRWRRRLNPQLLIVYGLLAGGLALMMIYAHRVNAEIAPYLNRPLGEVPFKVLRSRISLQFTCLIFVFSSLYIRRS